MGDFGNGTRNYGPKQEKIPINPPDTPKSKSDIYALGVTIYNTAVCDLKGEYMRAMGRFDIMATFWKYNKIPQCGDQFNELIQAMISFWGKDRPTAQMLVNHPLINVKLRNELNQNKGN